MGAQHNSPCNIASILNNDDHPSFAVRPKPKHTTSEPPNVTRISHESSRPVLSQLSSYRSHSSDPESPALSPRTPPLLRLDSSSTEGTMDSPPPGTPIYPYDGRIVVPNDTLLRNDFSAYGVPPMLYTDEPPQYAYANLANVSKSIPASSVPQLDTNLHHTYPPLPSPTISNEMSPALAPSSATSATIPPTTKGPTVPVQQAQSQSHLGSRSSQPKPQAQQQVQQQAQQQAQPPKKNKYPCPYAQSHGCNSTFTTSGHAARHGKKHTGEKGVLCPVCGKAFTRKDNMKQHERTHRGSVSTNSEDVSSNVPAGASKTKEDVRKRRKEDVRRESMDAMSPTVVPNAVYEPSAFDTSGYPPLPTDPAPMRQNFPLQQQQQQQQPQPQRIQPSVRPGIGFSSTGTGRTYSDLDTLAMAASGVRYDDYMQ